MTRKRVDFTPEQLAKAIQYRERGFSVRRIGEEMGSSYDVVLRELKAAGEHSHSREGKVKLTMDEATTAKEMLLTTTQKAVAAHFKVKPKSLVNALNRYFPGSSVTRPRARKKVGPKPTGMLLLGWDRALASQSFPMMRTDTQKQTRWVC